jgi:Protein of unknown function (DUF1569)
MTFCKSCLCILFFLWGATVKAQNNDNMAYQNVKSTNFYEPANYQSLLNRLDNIQPNSERKWGQMTVAQMLHHLNLAIGSGLGFYDLPDDSNLMSRTVNQFMVLEVLQRFPIGTQTAQPLKVVADDFDFEKEKKELRSILEKAYQTKSNDDWGRHTYFGRMSRKAWGKLIMIHCNHHFQQFSN